MCFRPDLASPPCGPWGPACASGPTWHRLRKRPQGKPRESRGSSLRGPARDPGERESERYVAAKRPASPSPWPRSGPHHTAERPVSPKGRFRHRVLELWDGFWTLTRFGALTAIRVMDINGTIFGSKLGFFRSGNHSGSSLGPQNPMVFPVRVQFGHWKSRVFHFGTSLSPELLGFSIPDLMLDAGSASYGPHTSICCPREPGSD